MSQFNPLTFDTLMETLARLADRLSQEPFRLCPRLLTVDQAAIYLGRTKEAVQHMVSVGKVPTVRTDRRVFLDRNDLDHWIETSKTI